MKLYEYFRSSAAYRVRIALNLKNLPYESICVSLQKSEHDRNQFKKINPQGLVPVLDDDGMVLTQSFVIMDYLDSTYPEPALMPSNQRERAYVSSIALSIACDIHPLNNLRVLRYLDYNLGLDENQRDGWYQHWIAQGLGALEEMISSEARSGQFCLSDSPTVADVFLVPQMTNARRFNCDLSNYPLLTAIDGRCRELKAFIDAAPENQPDAI